MNPKPMFELTGQFRGGVEIDDVHTHNHSFLYLVRHQRNYLPTGKPSIFDSGSVRDRFPCKFLTFFRSLLLSHLHPRCKLESGREWKR